MSNIVGHLGDGVERLIQERAASDYLSRVDPEPGSRVAHSLGIHKPRPDGARA
jgi:catalase